jgi:ketosteroid isomerase-like protein
MSQLNVEVVRRYYEATRRAFLAYWEDPRSAADALRAGELSTEAVEMMRCLHPSAEWKTALTGVTYRGYGDMASGFDQLVEVASIYRIEVEEIIDLGGDRVLAAVEAAMRGKASDIGVTSVIFVVVTVRDGVITRMDEYVDRAEALEAVGLSE